MPDDSLNIQKHINTYLLICNTLKITVTIAHKIKCSVSACCSLHGNESYLINISQIII
jgi:hypothetical protein